MWRRFAALPKTSVARRRFTFQANVWMRVWGKMNALLSGALEAIRNGKLTGMHHSNYGRPRILKF